MKYMHMFALVLAAVITLSSCHPVSVLGADGNVSVKFTWNESAKTLVSYQIVGASDPTITTGFPSGSIVNGTYYTPVSNANLSVHFVFSDATTYTFTKKFEADPGKRALARSSPPTGPSGMDNYYTVNLDGAVEVVTVSHNP